MPADKSYAFVSPRQNKTDRKIPSAISRAVVASPMPRQDDCFRTPRRSTRTPPLETSHSFTHCQATRYAHFLNSTCGVSTACLEFSASLDAPCCRAHDELAERMQPVLSL